MSRLGNEEEGGMREMQSSTSQIWNLSAIDFLGEIEKCKSPKLPYNIT
jgi:hypothetical protein